MASILILGGAGFIGRHTAAALVAAGHEVAATCRARSAMPVGGVRWIVCDLTDPQASATWPRRCDAVVFLAQAANWRAFPDTAADIFAVNVRALAAAAEYARRAGARQFVYASSGSVYSATDAPAVESDPIDLAAPRGYYVASKLVGELLLGPYEHLFSVACLRLFMPYGLGQHADMLLPTIVRNVREGKPVLLHEPDGLVCRPTAVCDVAETVCRLMRQDGAGTFNVCGPETHTLRSIALAVGEFVGRTPCFEYQPGRAPVIAGDVGALQRSLGWIPPTELRLGLRDWLASEMMARRAAG